MSMNLDGERLAEEVARALGAQIAALTIENARLAAALNQLTERDNAEADDGSDQAEATRTLGM